MDVRLVQLEKAFLPIDVNEDEIGIMMYVRLVQPLKATSPIDVTESGIVMDVNKVQ